MKKTILIFTSLLILVVSANASSKLYQNYEFGMSKSQIMEIPKSMIALKNLRKMPLPRWAKICRREC